MSETASAGLDRLDRDVVHEICTNQVVVTLHACVKELVENALDAGATRVEVRLRESGSELLEVVDNGRGISPDDYAKVAQRHATSKIRGYDDLSQSLSTFGFRGEALSAIAAMGDMTVCTRTAGDTTAALLSYDRFGKLSSQVPAAREAGTTVSVRELFRRLPVRHREFLRSAKAQVGATLRLVQAYAIAQPGVRFHVVAEKTKGHGAGRATLLSTSGVASGWRQASAAVLGDAATVAVEPFELHSEKTGWDVSGLISTAVGGRRTRDTQLYFVNRRPIDPPKRIAKLINDVYHQYNSRMWPVVILSFTAGQGLVDVNVTPDKRTVFLHNEEQLLGEVQEALTDLFTPKAQGGGPALADFGIKSVPKGQPGGSAGAPAGAADAASLLSSPDAREAAGGADDGSRASVAPVLAASPTLEATTPKPVDPPRKGLQACPGGLQADAGILQTPEKLSSPVLGEGPGAAGAAEPEDELPAFRVVDFSPPSEPCESAASAVRADHRVSAPMAAWGHSLQQRHPGGEDDAGPGEPEFRIIELDPSSVADGSGLAEPASDVPMGAEPVGKECSVEGSASVDDGGFVLTEEYHPEAPAPPPVQLQPEMRSKLPETPRLGGTSPPRPEPPPRAAGAGPTAAAEALPGGSELPTAMAVDEPSARPPEVVPALRRDAIGGSVRTAVSLAELGAAVARRRHRWDARSAAGASASSAPAVHFPSAFSLSSLRGGEQGKSSLEEVAKFATSSSPGRSEDEMTGLGLTFDKQCFSKMRVIGQFNLGFIIAALRTAAGGEGKQGEEDKQSGHGGLQLFIIDQHASDEKFRFEGLNRESCIDRQPLVTAHHLQLTPAQEQLAESHLEVFRLNGFELRKDEDRAPGRRLRLATLPTCQGLVFGERDIHDLLYTLEEAEAEQRQPGSDGAATNGGRLLDLAGHRGLWSSTALPRPAKVWQLLACRACRGAVMIGKALRVGEMERILSNLSSLEQPWNCPHGRPTMRHLIDTAAARKVVRPRPPLSKLLAQAVA